LQDRFVPGDIPRSHAIAKYPAFTASYASFKFISVFDHFMKPYFGISDFFVRSEWQHQGAQHWHGLLWLDDAPDTETAAHTEIPAFVDRWVSCVNTTTVAPGEVPDDQLFYAAPSANYQPAAMLLSAVENHVEDQKILLQHVQRHKQHTGYCLRVRVGEANSTMPTVAVTSTGEQYYRFGFLKAPCPATSVRVRRRGGIHVSMKVHPERNDPLVNSYNPPLLQLWSTNTVVSAALLTDVAKYIAKYVSKEKTSSSAYGDFVRRLVEHELPDSASKRDVAVKLLIKTVGDRNICAQELCALISGEALYTVSRSFVSLTAPGSPCFQQRVGDSSRVDIEPYMRRPDTLSDLLLLVVIHLYTLCCAGGPVAVLESRRRNPVVARVVPFLSSASDGSHFEEYCFQRLVLHKPFRAWGDILEVYSSAIQAASAFFGDQDTVADLDDAVREAVIELANEVPVPESDRVLLPVSNPFDTGPLVAPPASVSVAPEPTPDHHDWASACQHLHVIVPNADQFIRFRRENTPLPARSSSVDSARADGQRAVFDTVIAHHSAGTPEPLRLLVLGTAGSGKSYLLGCLSQSLCGSCVVLAPTGVAALNVNGSTYYSFLRRKTTSYNALRGPHLLEFQRACASLRYIIIDELSMLGCSALLAVDQRLR